MAVRPADSWKALRLDEAVLAGRGVEHEQHLGLRLGQPLADRAADLGQLLHEVGLGVQPPRGVHDDDVRSPRAAAASIGVPDDGRRVGARGVGDDAARRCARPRSVSCSMAAARNVSAAARSTFAPRVLKRHASFAMVVVLPVPLTPDDEDDRGHASGPASAATGSGSRSRRAPGARAGARPRAAGRGARAPGRSTSIASSAPRSAAMSASSTCSQASSSGVTPPPSRPRTRAAERAAGRLERIEQRARAPGGLVGHAPMRPSSADAARRADSGRRRPRAPAGRPGGAR